MKVEHIPKERLDKAMIYRIHNDDYTEEILIMIEEGEPRFYKEIESIGYYGTEGGED